MSAAEDIFETALAFYFPDTGARAEVRRELDAIANIEAVRVRTAVLRLADGDREELRRYIESARTDYRDVLAWTEYSAAFAVPPGAPADQKRAAQKKDAEATAAWLARIGYG